MKKKLLVLIAAIAGSCAVTLAQETAVQTNTKGWNKIGETTVNMSVDRDKIDVTGHNLFTAIKFKVTDAAINIWDITVGFENGESQEVQVRQLIRKGGETRKIDLAGKDRYVKSISLVYKTVPNDRTERATVEVYGWRPEVDKKVDKAADADMKKD